MSAHEKNSDAEETGAGSQALMRGVKPITLCDRLGFLVAGTMGPIAVQKRCDYGLFDFESRRRTDLVDELRLLNRNDDLTSPITNKGE